jgi:hypothetical protein
VTVEGYDTGINGSAGHSATLENITLLNQKVRGLLNDGTDNSLFIRKLTSTQNLAIPVIKCDGHLVLLDSTFTSSVSGSDAVVCNPYGTVFVRNLQTSGYAKAISRSGRDAIGPNVAEWTSSDVSTVFPAATTSLNLPIKDAPEIPWDEDFSQWANILDYGAPEHYVATSGGATRTVKNYSPLLQRAIDSGKTTIYLPKMALPYQTGFYTDVRIRGNVKRLIFMEAALGQLYGPAGKFILDEGTADAVVLERADSMYGAVQIVQASSRTLVVRNLSVRNIVVLPNTGDVFLEDITGEYSEQTLSVGANANVWARQFNPEGSGDLHAMRNTGGNLWVFGLKTEGNVGKLYAEGGKNEVFAYILANSGTDNTFGLRSLFDLNNSAFSGYVTEYTLRSNLFPMTVSETRGGETRTLNNTGTSGAQVPLFIGYETNPAVLPPIPAIAPGSLTASVASAHPDQPHLDGPEPQRRRLPHRTPHRPRQ